MSLIPRLFSISVLLAGLASATPIDLPTTGGLGASASSGPGVSLGNLLGGDLTIPNILPAGVASPLDLTSTIAGLDIAPLKEKRQLPGLSLPGLSLPGPLIPEVPGVTDVLTNNAPPLPVLQVPTPPLDSPPFTVVKGLKPKKIGYFWTGAGDNKHKDFLVTTSLDDVRSS
jgi:hypothetical protein